MKHETEKLAEAITTLENSYNAYMEIMSENPHLKLDETIFTAMPAVTQAARQYAEVLRVYEELKSVGALPVSHKVAGFDKIAAIVARGD